MSRKKKKLFGRELNGIVLLDKGIGASSNGALQRVRHLFKARKAGHTGSLDPLASGMLPICFGEATKVSGFLLDSDKAYIATAVLGQTTTTGDKEGEVFEERPVPEITFELLDRIVEKFSGNIVQTPPMHSALKHNGTPLYKLARKGVEVERKQREVTIHSLKILEFSQEHLSVEVHCSKGTYIRTLLEDIGEFIGCGAHLSLLRRTIVSPFDEFPMYSYDALEALWKESPEKLDEVLLPIDAAINDWPRMDLSEEETRLIRHGVKIDRGELPDRLFSLFNHECEFIGIARRSSEGLLTPKRLIARE